MADALPTAEIAVRAGVDCLEVGTPLILGEGLHAVKALHERYPDHPVVADLKTAAQCPALGASLVVIGAPLAVADYELKPGADADKLFDIISRFVCQVKDPRRA